MFGKTSINKARSQEIEEKKESGTDSSKGSCDWFDVKAPKAPNRLGRLQAPEGKGGNKSCGRCSGEKRKRYPSCRPTPGGLKKEAKS